MKRWLGLMLFSCAWACLARAGRVQTQDGATYLGSIRLEPDRLIVANVNEASLIPIDAATLRRASFEPPLAPVPDSIMVRQQWTELPVPWRKSQIGGAASIGNWRGGLFEIEVNEGKQELIYQLLGRRAEAVVRVLAVPTEGRADAEAGLMLRDSLDPGARMVFLGMSAGHQGILRWRDQSGGPVHSALARSMSAPYWLRLKREDNVVSAYCSSSGDRWRLIERLELALGEEVLAGLAASGGESNPKQTRAAGAALLDNVRVGRSIPLSSFIPRAVLRGGSILSGTMQAPLGETLSFLGPLPRPTLRLQDIAFLQFQWLSAKAREGINAGRAGVYLMDGEFVEGDFHGIEGDRLRMSSVLFGLKTYDLNNEVMAVSLRMPEETPASYEVATADGCLWRATFLEIGEHEVIIREPALGRVHLSVHNLVEIRRGD